MPPIVLNLVIPMIITLVLVVLYVVLCTKLLKNKDEKTKLMPVRIIFYLMIVCEVIKIIYLIKRDGSFNPGHFPIVFCSMSMYMFPLFCFKQNKFSDFAKTMAVFPGIIAFLMFASIQYKYNFSLLQAHSYFYHGSMLAVGIYLITSKIYKFEFKKFYDLFLGFSSYLIIAGFLSVFIGGSISVFGPTDKNLAFLYNATGYGIGILLMMVAVFVAGFIVYGIISLIQNKKQKVESNKTNEIEENVVIETETKTNKSKKVKGE